VTTVKCGGTKNLIVAEQGIVKKPKRHQTASSNDPAAERFIAGAGRPRVPPERYRTPTTLRFDPDLLARIDAAARRRGISRSAWIQYTLSRVLDEENV
jgi:predicted HicB family RNase H-like nuclease